MGFLVTETNVRFINAESIKLQEVIPNGIWKYGFSQLGGSYLEKAEMNLSHGKIYGESEKIANHIVEAYKKSDASKNLGVLMSGGKGLGKSLTAKLIIEQLKNEKPIIIVDTYTVDLPDFLNKIENCVIMLDEFEKVIPSENEEEGCGPTGQESLLSVLDGTSGSKGNLFILTVNNTFKIDENMKSRPGRIRYHYRFKTSTKQTILNYCEDMLEDKSKMEEIANSLIATNFVSMDIITAVVDEVNKFPETPISEILDYMNIEVSEQEALITLVVKNSKEEVVTCEVVRTFRPNKTDEFWVEREVTDEEGDTDTVYPCMVGVDYSKIRKIPYIGKAAITKAVHVKKYNQNNGPWTLVGATIESVDDKHDDF